MAIRAIFFDIDGTLLMSNGKIAETTKQAIYAAKAQGILCGIATGRGPKHLTSEILELPFDFYVTYNGQYVYNRKKELLFAQAFSIAFQKELIQATQALNVPLMLCGAKKNYGHWLLRFSQLNLLQMGYSIVHRSAGRVIALHKKWRQSNGRRKAVSFKTQRPMQPVVQEPIYQGVILANAAQQAQLIQNFSAGEFTRSNAYLCDVVQPGLSKVRGIEACGAKYQFTLAEVLVFGDQANDLTMLKAVGVGVAMGNAATEVKQVADFVTASNNDNGIAQALIKYRIISEGDLR